MTVAAGSYIGPYRVVGRLGTGGMGEVYRAHDDRLNRDVAVKILPAAVANDAGRLERFEREARASAALNHPNIVATYDIGRAAGMTYVVMELIDGVTLREALTATPPTPHKSIAWTVEIAQGLAAAHAKGIVHRDIKPENLLVCADGRVKILDFGIARLTTDEPRTTTDASTMAAGTEPGTVMGTAGYMSPEQVRGQVVDARSDIFSLGAVLFEMLAGRRAFTGDTAVETMHAVLKNDPPELAGPGSTVAPAFDRIVRRCLEKRPEDRFYSAHDLAFALEAVSGSRTEPVVALPPAPRRRGWLVAAALALLVVAGTAGLTWWLARGEIRELPAIRQITVRRGTIEAARFTKAGDSVVYSAQFGGGAPAAFETHLNNPEARQVGPENAVMFAASEGGLALGLRPYLSGGRTKATLAAQPPGAGTAREVAEGIVGADFAADGLAAIDSDGNLWRVHFPVGKIVFETPKPTHLVRATPDGRRIAVVTGGEVVVIAADGTRETIEGGASGIAWSPNGERLWFSAGSGTGASSIFSVVPGGGTPRLEWRAPGIVVLQDIARDGRLLVRRDEVQGGSAVIGPDSPQPVDVSWLDRSTSVAISATTRKILLNDAAGMYLRDLDGSPAVRLGSGPGTALSSDGRLTVSHGTEGFEIAPVGPGAPRQLSRPGIDSHFAWFHPDGRRLVFNGRARGGKWRYFTVALDGSGSPTPVGPDNFEHYVGQEAVSNDGRWLLGFPLPERTLTVHALDGTESIPVKGLQPREVPSRFAEADREIFVFNREGLPTQVHRLNFRTGERRLWREFRPGDAAGIAGIQTIAMTADGRIIAFNYRRVLSTLFQVSGLVR